MLKHLAAVIVVFRLSSGAKDSDTTSRILSICSILPNSRWLAALIIAALARVPWNSTNWVFSISRRFLLLTSELLAINLLEVFIRNALWHTFFGDVLCWLGFYRVWPIDILGRGVHSSWAYFWSRDHHITELRVSCFVNARAYFPHNYALTWKMLLLNLNRIFDFIHIWTSLIIARCIWKRLVGTSSIWRFSPSLTAAIWREIRTLKIVFLRGPLASIRLGNVWLQPLGLWLNIFIGKLIIVFFH